MPRLLISVENAEFQIIESLKNNRTKRCASGEIFIEGIECIKQAFKAGLDVTRIIIRKNISSWAAEAIGGHEKTRVKIIEMTDALYRKLCDRDEPSEMLITAVMPKPVKKSVSAEKPFILVLDRPSDTGNLGSIIRSANAFGVDEVFIIGHGVDPWDPKTIRASLGSVFFTIPAQIESVAKLEEYIAIQKNHCGIKVFGTDSGGGSSLGSMEIKRPLMLILGNEAKGMSRAAKSLCENIVSIPMMGNINSLNLASAAGIFMWEAEKNSKNIFE